MKDRITKRLVDSLEPIEGKRLRVYDDQLVGFGVAVQPTGKKGFFIEYGPADHRRRMVLGNYGALTVDAARKRAALELAKVVDGVDPMVARQERRNMPTVGDWVTEYLEGVRRRKKQPRQPTTASTVEHHWDGLRNRARESETESQGVPIRPEVGLAARYARGLRWIKP